jgi:hypothetical protein
MLLFANSMLVPVLVAGPLLVGSSWLLWVVLGRAAFKAGKPGVRRRWHPAVVILGIVLFLSVTGAVLLTIGHAWYMRGINKSNARMEVLRQTYMLLDQYEDEHGRPPATVDDLAQFAAECPKGFAAIQIGEVIVLCRRSVRLPRSESVVVAHEPIGVHRTTLLLYSDGHIAREDSDSAAGLIDKTDDKKVEPEGVKLQKQRDGEELAKEPDSPTKAVVVNELRDLDLRRMGSAEYHLPIESHVVTDRTPGPPSRLSLIALPDDAGPEVGRHRGMRLLLVNKSDAEPQALAYDRKRRLLLFNREAIDVEGKWKRIEEEFCPWCGTGFKQINLEPRRWWELAAVRYSGEVKTRVRFRLIVFDADRSWAVSSNEFDGWVNPEQFSPPSPD